MTRSSRSGSLQNPGRGWMNGISAISKAWAASVAYKLSGLASLVAPGRSLPLSRQKDPPAEQKNAPGQILVGPVADKGLLTDMFDENGRLVAQKPSWLCF